MWAAYNGEKNVVELLLTHRANLGVLNNVSMIYYGVVHGHVSVQFSMYLHELYRR